MCGQWNTYALADSDEWRHALSDAAARPTPGMQLLQSTLQAEIAFLGHEQRFREASAKKVEKDQVQTELEQRKRFVQGLECVGTWLLNQKDKIERAM